MASPATPPRRKQLSIVTPDEINSETSSPTSPHTYTSLSSLRKSQKGKEPDKADRKNGWHLWSQENPDGAGGRGAAAGRDLERAAVQGRVPGEKKGPPGKLSMWNMVRFPPAVFRISYNGLTRGLLSSFVDYDDPWDGRSSKQVHALPTVLSALPPPNECSTLLAASVAWCLEMGFVDTRFYL